MMTFDKAQTSDIVLKLVRKLLKFHLNVPSESDSGFGGLGCNCIEYQNVIIYMDQIGCTLGWFDLFWAMIQGTPFSISIHKSP